MNWQPIETAPADRPFLAYYPQYPDSRGRIVEQVVRMPRGRIFTFVSRHLPGRYFDATHWADVPPITLRAVARRMLDFATAWGFGAVRMFYGNTPPQK